ncbi:hypothetical protein U1701_00455 [Sphingomonas sp. PB2P19]|uniref:hypothetical protein n=1 Tax=Sphingomonas rhamnosi TaxID=3096156 RepID=UPI002FC77C1F
MEIGKDVQQLRRMRALIEEALLVADLNDDVLIAAKLRDVIAYLDETLTHP